MSEKDIDDAMREIRIALLEADVSLPVVKEFIAKVKEQSVGEKVVRSIQPGRWWSKLSMTNLSNCSAVRVPN